MIRFALRFLWAVSPHFRQASVVLASVAVFGVWTATAFPGDVGAPYLLLLFCQLFAASSGFRASAESGHFDLLLTGGVSRHVLAVWHWGLSVVPGCVAWTVVCSAEAWTDGVHAAAGLRAPSLMGLMLVSSLPWVLTLPSSRFVGGTLWMVTMVLTGTSAHGFEWIRGLMDGSAPNGLAGLFETTIAVVIVPFLFLVPAVGEVTGDPAILISTGLISCAAVAIGISWIVHRDFPGAS